MLASLTSAKQPMSAAEVVQTEPGDNERPLANPAVSPHSDMHASGPMAALSSRLTTVFLCGDVMTGRGIDQILRHPSDPRLHEPSVQDARGYVSLAERRNGPVPRLVSPQYIWGDALAELERIRPRARIINLETSVTRSEDWLAKGINYRMHPENVDSLGAAGIDLAVLANNHVLDWGTAGLKETLATLARAGIRTVGAGETIAEARQPAILGLDPGQRLIVFGFASPTSGVPPAWAATENRAGLNVLIDLSESAAAGIEERVRDLKRPGDLVIASLHWGGNWGYQVPQPFERFAHRLIDGGVDLVHGHSSHHFRPIEVYRGRLILYGCGDLINDYEGITGHEAFRPDLALLYFPLLDCESGALAELRMVPMQIRRLGLRRPSEADVLWLMEKMNRVAFGASIERDQDGSLCLRPLAGPARR
jgi:poly-gamma-glutamate synthesis protein (capsule biosynthesis protein)